MVLYRPMLATHSNPELPHCAMAEMYSSTSCSIRLQRSWGFVVFVMRDEFAGPVIAAQPLR